MRSENKDIRNIAYENSNRGLKEHEKLMIKYVQENIQDSRVDILDIGCADGLFLDELSKVVDCNRLDGIDNDPNLITTANEKVYKANESVFYCCDIQEFISASHEINKRKYDVIIASGILACIENVDGLIKATANSLKSGGRIYIFGSQLSRPVDIRYSIRPHGKDEWECERFILSLENLKKILMKYLENITVKQFELPFDLVEKPNVCSTYSVKTEDGTRMILSKFNVLAEIFYVIAKKK